MKNRKVRPIAKQRTYVPVSHKFFIACTTSIVWLLLSVWLSLTWIDDLAQLVPYWLAASIITLIAFLPGFINAFVCTALLLDERPIRKVITDYPSITILIAAYNEAAVIQKTLRSLQKQNYPSNVYIIVINDGSTDETANEVMELIPEIHGLSLMNLHQNVGKAQALNRGLQEVYTEHVITIDADCHVRYNALTHIVERYLSDPPNTKAVAGAVLAGNSRQNWITKAQEWDYFLGIAASKRIQSLFQGTLVAQGAFSMYDTQVIRALGGWPNTVGEDIVLSWNLLTHGYRIGYAEDAMVFTDCPSTLKQFIRQRQRWSRGLIEAFKFNPSLALKPRFTLLFIWWNALFPLMDVAYTMAYLPGLILALFGIFWLAGPMTLALIPPSLLLGWVMYKAGRQVFDQEYLRIRTNKSGFIFYILAYGMILQPACVWGYLTELMMRQKYWGTK